MNQNKERRFEEIKKWSFIAERRVELNLGDYDVFLMRLLRRNWKKLAEPLRKFNVEAVREFYANAWAEKQERDERKTMVRGCWIPYSPQAIDDLLAMKLGHFIFDDVSVSDTYRTLTPVRHSYDTY